MKVLFIKKFALLHLYLCCMHVCGQVHDMAHHSTHAEVIGLLVGVSSLCITWLLKTELWSSGLAARAVEPFSAVSYIIRIFIFIFLSPNA